MSRNTFNVNFVCLCYLHFGCSKLLLGALADVRARKTLHWYGPADSVDVVQSGAIHLPLQCLIIIVINIVIIISITIVITIIIILSAPCNLVVHMFLLMRFQVEHLNQGARLEQHLH